jgi:hypothetical protein
VALTFRSAPRISRTQWRAILTSRGSPVAPVADECYNIVVAAGLDPAVALAFFAKESTFGTAGVSVEAKNWGNVRTPQRPELACGRVTSRRGHGEYVAYRTWQDGLMDWCARINEKYIDGWGLTTIEAALPKYAPASDNNDTALYIRQVCDWVARWQREDPDPTHADVGDAMVGGPTTQGDEHMHALREALIRETFAVNGATFHPEWAFHQYALSEAQAGRPLGAPQADVVYIKVGGVDYALQVFALDTLYVAVPNWSEIKRLSQLLA